MKEVYYFPHDYEANNDPKILALIGAFGAAGYGIYWRLIELLHSESDHKIKKKEYVYQAIAKQMLVDASVIKDLLNYACEVCELLEENDGFYWSNRVLRNFEKRSEISEKRREAGRIGGKKSPLKALNSDIDQNSIKQNEASAKQNEAIAKQNNETAKQNETKEIKGKEIKGKEIKGKEIKEEENKDNKKSHECSTPVRYLISENPEAEPTPNPPPATAKTVNTQKEILKDVVFPFLSESFQKTWDVWLKFRTDSRKPYKSVTSMQAALKELSEYPEPVAIKAIEKSIAAGWQGIFPEKINEQYRKNNQSGNQQAPGANLKGIYAAAGRFYPEQ